MEELNILDQKIIHVLQNFPLEPYSSLAKKPELNISPQTMIRKVKSLKDRGILRIFISDFVPEKFSLVRYSVLLPISQLHQFTLLENALSKHNYIRGYNRFYGESFGTYATFDFPVDQEDNLRKFLEYCVEKEFCNGYKINKSMGYRFSKPSSIPEYSAEPKPFDLIRYWQQRLECEERLPRLGSPVNLETLEPLHLKLLADLTTTQKNGIVIDARTKQTDLIQHYRGLKRSLEKKANKSDFEKKLLANLVEFFKEKNDYHLKVEFGRKYYKIIKDALTNFRWNIERKITEHNVTRAFFIEDIPNKEK
ncbi:MAG: hypothetical protein ACTSRO_09560, partial [Candidatus Heimdallarchaeaceae archaeon]